MRYLGSVLRASGEREDVTYALTARLHPRHPQRVATDFRTTDGEPLMLYSDDTLSIPIPAEEAA